jgi:hypothetical protein
MPIVLAQIFTSLKRLELRGPCSVRAGCGAVFQIAVSLRPSAMSLCSTSPRRVYAIESIVNVATAVIALLAVLRSERARGGAGGFQGAA